MSNRTKVYIPSEDAEGEIVQHMSHGARIVYYQLGHEFDEVFDSDDYVTLEDDNESD